jgi:hypothetical protein
MMRINFNVANAANINSLRMKQLNEREQWFHDRIGKVVYRNDNGCHCDCCQAIRKYGITILDRLSAIYLYDCELEFTGEGHPLRYFDTLDEVEEFEKKNKK